MYNPLTIHPGIPAMPQIASSAATTARISIVTAHDNIFFQVEGLKRANLGEKGKQLRVRDLARRNPSGRPYCTCSVQAPQA